MKKLLPPKLTSDGKRRTVVNHKMLLFCGVVLVSLTGGFTAVLRPFVDYSFGTEAKPKVPVLVNETIPSESRPVAANETNPIEPANVDHSLEQRNEDAMKIPSESPPVVVNETKPVEPAMVDHSPLQWNEDTMKRVQNGSIQGASVPAVVGGVVGSIQEGRLVVTVNQTYMFWHDAQSKLCKLLQSMTLKDTLDSKNDTVHPKPLLNVLVDCVTLSHDQDFGQGNWLTAYYMTRIAAALARVDFQFSCTDGEKSRLNLLLPWFAGFHAAPDTTDPWPYTGDLPNQGMACTNQYPKIRVDKMADQVIDQVQRMAVTLVGSRDSVRRHPDVPVDQPPLVPNITLDDVAIHFRCGDVMGGANRNDFGMIKFTEYPKRLTRTTVHRVGILTQPFERARNRRRDKGKTEHCRQAVELMIEYLQGFYPNATFTIHNGPGETTPLAYARLTMANHSFTSLSSFGIFPVMATFGDGYFQRGNRGVNPFTTMLPKYYKNLHEMNAPRLGTGQIRKMTLEDVLEWFVSDGNKV